MLQKVFTMKRFEYSPLGKNLKSQIGIAKKQYQKLDDTYEFDKIIKKEKPIFKKYNRSNLIYDRKYCFYAYYNIKYFNRLSLMSKYPILLSLYSNLNKFNNLNLRKEYKTKRKTIVYDNASELHNDCLEIYFDEYKSLPNIKKRVG